MTVKDAQKRLSDGADKLVTYKGGRFILCEVILWFDMQNSCYRYSANLLDLNKNSILRVPLEMVEA